MKKFVDYLAFKYQDSIGESLKDLNEDKICIACLGILQDMDNPEYLQRIMQKIESSGYETKNYCLTMTLPVAINLRHYELWYHLQNKFPEIESLQTPAGGSDIPEVKEVFKWIMGNKIYKSLSMEFKFEARFEVRLEIQHQETQLECLKLSIGMDAKDYLKQLEEQKRFFLKINSEENVVEYEAKDFDKARDFKEFFFKETLPKRKRKKTKASIDGINTINNKLRSLKKLDFLKLMSDNLIISEEQLPMPPETIKTHCEFEFSFHHLAVYVAGRYCKYSRELSQSPWIINGIRRGESSVQEYIGNVLLNHFKASGYKFISAGREDIDVRMLGNGRPWAMELINCKKPTIDQQELILIQKEINLAAKNILFIQDLQNVSEKQVNMLKEGEETKQKIYRCVVWAPKPMSAEKLNSLEKMSVFQIDQLTPVRVLHRRSLLNRKKNIYKLKAQYVTDHYAILDLKTQAGTYIKEFIHSDLGRTSPSFCEFIGQEEADILRLDVMQVELEFPKRLENQENPPEPSSILDGLDLSRKVPDLPEIFDGLCDD